MRRALTYFVVASALCTPELAADRKSWNKIRYVGGTVAVKTSPYDWNTTLTVRTNPDSIEVTIAPATGFAPRQTVRIKPAQVLALLAGPAAWRKVGEVDGTHLPAKAPALFGLLQDNGFLGIVYQTEDGKRAALLLDSYFSFKILQILHAVTGKPVEDSP